MDLSGIIFVVLALAWAVYLIPKALKHHDEVARTRSIDRFSTAMRVLARREPVTPRDARLVVATPARNSARGTASDPVSERVAKVPAGSEDKSPASSDSDSGVAAEPSVLTVTMRPAVPRARLAARRAAARAAARRRRRILTFLLLCDVAVAAMAYFAVLQWWAVAVPGALTLLYLALCRTQVRRETAADFEVLAGRPNAEATGAEKPAAEVRVAQVRVEQDGPGEAVDAEPVEVSAVVQVVQARVDEDGVADFGDTEDTVGVPVALLDAVAVPTAGGGTLWDPLPVTLPTYVTKPRAKRTVRTIDLGEPGTWTSGHTAEDTRIAAQAEADGAGTVAADSAEPHRAVGS